MKNKLLIASAGAGKTTMFVKEALSCTESVLITTFTEENEKEIKKKFIKLNNGIIPPNITIQTWFSFLIEHGAKPYQGKLTEKKINGLFLVNEKSGLKYKGKYPVYFKEDEIDKHYFTEDYQIYSDKLSKFCVRCNEKSNGYVVERISALFQRIYIDEVQDMAGYDLEFIKLLLQTNSVVKMAGDPRQVTYHTHFSDKYKKYSSGKIQEFIQNECKKINCDVDTETLKEYCPLQLRYSRTKKVNLNYQTKNFGESKGATYDRVLIYPTQKILDWLFDNKDINSFEVKCKFYVAVTRAKYSVAIVCKNDVNTEVLPIYQSNV